MKWTGCCRAAVYAWEVEKAHHPLSADVIRPCRNGFAAAARGFQPTLQIGTWVPGSLTPRLAKARGAPSHFTNLSWISPYSSVKAGHPPMYLM